jgi:hypothetical protein
MSLLFELTAGTHPLFVSLHDSGSRPDGVLTGTLAEKRNAFKATLQHGVHRFTRTNHVGNDYDVIAVDDPWGWSTTASFANFPAPAPTWDSSAASLPAPPPACRARTCARSWMGR